MRKRVRLILASLIVLFIFINMVACFHAYKFTHFASTTITKTTDPGKLSFSARLKTILFGINNPRPVNDTGPPVPYTTVMIQSNKKTECWSIPAENPKGTVILFHGYGGSKSSLLDKSLVFQSLGYSTLLVDFMGSGGSEGNQTTIGFLEAQQVRSCFDYLSAKGEKNIFLFGTSMGAVAIMKSINDYKLKPQGIIIECPFGTMYQTVCARFRLMHAPTFPMAGVLLFWGGVQNGFWAFGHNPTEYARQISCPTLLMYGEQDNRVSRAEIDEIYTNLPARKHLVTFPGAGHENYLARYQTEWTTEVKAFIDAGTP